MILRPLDLPILLLTIVLLFCGCKPDPAGSVDRLEKNLLRAGSNRQELEMVLDYFENSGDSLKYKAAVVLISNMDPYYHYTGSWLEDFDRVFDSLASLDHREVQPFVDSMTAVLGSPEKDELQIRNDLRTLTAEFLIENIESAFYSWYSAPWKDSITFDMFCNFILPYKNYQEYPESWRSGLRQQYQWVLDNPYLGTSIKDATCAYTRDMQFWFQFTGALDEYPGRIGVSNLLKGKKGNCADMSGLGAYAGRALGIPIALDYTPQWGAGNDGHAWNVVYLNEHTTVDFMGTERRPEEFNSIREGEARLAKARRRVLIYQDSSFTARAEAMGVPVNGIPGKARDSRALDVTADYGPVADVNLEGLDAGRKVVYLCLYNKRGWTAIQGSIIRDDGSATFHDMGRALLYAPMYFERSKYILAQSPFLLTFDGDFLPLDCDNENLTEMTLQRKSPLSRHMTKFSFAAHLEGAVVEASNDEKFEQSQVLHTIRDLMEPYLVVETGGIRFRDQLEYGQLWEKRELDSEASFRYVRLRTQDGKLFRLGDIEFMEKGSGNVLGGEPMGSVENPGWAFDGTDGHSIIYDEYLPDAWVGLDMGQPKKLESFRIIPAQDRNRILPERTYELLYWDRSWKKHSSVRSEALFLHFRDVPQNTIYRLHCLDCKYDAERPFTYWDQRVQWW